MGVIIKGKAKKKIKAYAKVKKSSEIGGLLCGKLDDNGDIIIKDAILLEQGAISSHFEITEDVMMEFTKNASPKKLKSIIGWWHSHMDFGLFWSGDDDLCFERMSKLSGFCIGVVVSSDGKKMNMKCKLVMRNRENNMVVIDDIKFDSDYEKFKINIGDIKDEVMKLVDFNQRQIVCPRCDGEGTIMIDNHIQMIKGDTGKYEPKEDKKLKLYDDDGEVITSYIR